MKQNEIRIHKILATWEISILWIFNIKYNFSFIIHRRNYSINLNFYHSEVSDYIIYRIIGLLLSEILRYNCIIINFYY